MWCEFSGQPSQSGDKRNGIVLICLTLCLQLTELHMRYKFHPMNHRHLFHSKIYAPSSSLLQGTYLPFSSSPLHLNIFRLFVILSLTQLYHYTPEIVSECGLVKISVIETDTATSGLRWIFHMHSEFSRPAICNNAIMIISSQM